MTTCGTLTKSMLLLAVVVALTGQGSAGEGRMGTTGTWVLRVGYATRTKVRIAVLQCES